MEENQNKPENNNISRGDFLKKSAIAAASFYIVPRYVLGKGYKAPSDKLYIAAVGTGGEAENDIHHFATAPKKNAEIAFLCDVDERPAAERTVVGLDFGPGKLVTALGLDRECASQGVQAEHRVGARAQGNV